MNRTIKIAAATTAALLVASPAIAGKSVLRGGPAPTVPETPYTPPTPPISAPTMRLRWHSAQRDPNVSDRIFFKGYFYNGGGTFHLQGGNSLRRIGIYPVYQNLWVRCNGKGFKTTLHGKTYNFKEGKENICRTVFGRRKVADTTNKGVYNHVLGMCVPRAKSMPNFMYSLNECLRWNGLSPVSRPWHYGFV